MQEFIASHSYGMIHIHCGDHKKVLYEPSYLKPGKDAKNLYAIICAFINTLPQNAALDIFNHPNTHILRFKIRNSAVLAMFLGQFNPKKGTKETLDALEQSNSNALHTKPKHFWSQRFKRLSKSDFLYTQPLEVLQKSMSRNDILLALNIRTPKSDKALRADRAAEEARKSREISQEKKNMRALFPDIQPSFHATVYPLKEEDKLKLFQTAVCDETSSMYAKKLTQANKRAQHRIKKARQVKNQSLAPIEESPRAILQESTLNTASFFTDIHNMNVVFRHHALNMQRDAIKEKAEEKKEARNALKLPGHILHETFQPAGGSLKTRKV